MLFIEIKLQISVDFNNMEVKYTNISSKVIYVIINYCYFCLSNVISISVEVVFVHSNIKCKNKLVELSYNKINYVVYLFD